MIPTAEKSYPANYPCPTWEYSIGTTANQRRILFDSGWTRQRRRWAEYNASVSFEFEVPQDLFREWADWVNLNGYNFFDIELDVYGGTPQLATVRFTQPMAWQYRSYGIIVVNVIGESFGG